MEGGLDAVFTVKSGNIWKIRFIRENRKYFDTGCYVMKRKSRKWDGMPDISTGGLR